jgi:hypothetical protein
VGRVGGFVELDPGTVGFLVVSAVTKSEACGCTTEGFSLLGLLGGLQSIPFILLKGLIILAVDDSTTLEGHAAVVSHRTAGEVSVGGTLASITTLDNKTAADNQELPTSRG